MAGERPFTDHPARFCGRMITEISGPLQGRQAVPTRVKVPAALRAQNNFPIIGWPGQLVVRVA